MGRAVGSHGGLVGDDATPSPPEQCELCGIDLQTDGTVRPRNTAGLADHLGFLEAWPRPVSVSGHRARHPGAAGSDLCSSLGGGRDQIPGLCEECCHLLF